MTFNKHICQRKHTRQNIKTSVFPGSSFMLCSLSLTPLSPEAPTHWSDFYLYVETNFTYSKMLYKQNHTVYSCIQLLLLNIMSILVICVVVLVICCFLLPSIIPLHEFICWLTLGFFSVFRYYEYSSDECPCISLVWTHVFLWVNY